MSARAYVLLDITNGKSSQAVEDLRDKPGVLIADLLDGPPDVILVVEAPERQKLADLTNRALASVETVTEDICLLPVQDDLNINASPKLSSRKRKERGGSK
jgi:hypothetical protein